MFQNDTQPESEPPSSQCPTPTQNKAVTSRPHYSKETHRGIKRKTGSEDIYTKVLETINKSEDDIDHFALGVAGKLRKMEPYQKILCENLINTAVFKGQMGQLNEKMSFSESVEHPFYYSSVPPPPPLPPSPYHASTVPSASTSTFIPLFSGNTQPTNVRISNNQVWNPDSQPQQ